MRGEAIRHLHEDATNKKQGATLCRNCPLYGSVKVKQILIVYRGSLLYWLSWYRLVPLHQTAAGWFTRKQLCKISIHLVGRHVVFIA